MQVWLIKKKLGMQLPGCEVAIAGMFLCVKHDGCHWVICGPKNCVLCLLSSEKKPGANAWVPTS